MNTGKTGSTNFIIQINEMTTRWYQQNVKEEVLKPSWWNTQVRIKFNVFQSGKYLIPQSPLKLIVKDHNDLKPRDPTYII